MSIQHIDMKLNFGGKDLRNFVPRGDVRLTMMKKNNETILMCKCTKSGKGIGIVKTINLQQITNYTMEVTGIANNNRSYLYVADMHDNILFDQSNPIFLKNKKDTFSLQFMPRTSQIRIGILIGIDSLATTSDYFEISTIELSCTSQKEFLPGSSDLRITRIFETVKDLEREVRNPCRGNKTTPMDVGEYAVLKSEDRASDDLYVLSREGLQYVCRIGEGLPSFLGSPLHQPPGKTMPIYDDPKKAYQELEEDPEKFYECKGDYSWTDKVKNDIYLYLDPQGFVRWLRLGDLPSSRPSSLPPVDPDKEKVEQVSLIDL